MVNFLMINTKIGLVLTVIVYAVWLIFWLPAMVCLCKETHKTFWDYWNDFLKEVYEFEKPKHPMVIIGLWLCGLAEAIFVWEVHYPFIGWQIYKAFTEDTKESEQT